MDRQSTIQELIEAWHPVKPPGDLYITLQIALPPATNAKVKELHKTMAKELNFNPRRHLPLGL